MKCGLCSLQGGATAASKRLGTAQGGHFAQLILPRQLVCTLMKNNWKNPSKSLYEPKFLKKQRLKNIVSLFFELLCNANASKEKSPRNEIILEKCQFYSALKARN
jgi:hypothetical protein